MSEGDLHLLDELGGSQRLGPPQPEDNYDWLVRCGFLAIERADGTLELWHG